MTDPIPLEEVPEDLGRNDPCPCGSGKKYKKCCYRIHRVQKEAAKQSRSVEDLVDGTTTPWDYFKLLRQVYENNMVNLFYEMTHAQGSFRDRFATVEEFIEAVSGEERLVAGSEYDLRRIRHDGPDVMLLMARGLEDPRRDVVDHEVIRLRPNEIGADRKFRDVEHTGYRIWDIERHQNRKADLDDFDLSFKELGYEWSEAWDEID